MIIEAYGFIVLFSGFFPVAINFLRRIPVIGTILNLPGISSVSFFYDQLLKTTSLTVHPVKLRFCEKDTKTLQNHHLRFAISTVEISQNFLALTECMNFNRVTSFEQLSVVEFSGE
jgi:hypothetical protein